MCRWHLFVLGALLTGRVLCAQHAHPQSSPGFPAQLPVLVDGSKTPSLIPDNLAYQHFFRAVAAHPSPSTQEQDRQAAQLAPLQLSPLDQQILIQGLATFRGQYDQIEQDRAKLLTAIPDATTAAQLTNLKVQESGLLTSTLSNLRLSLTPNGANRLDQHVKTYVKAHIVIYGTPQ